MPRILFFARPYPLSIDNPRLFEGMAQAGLYVTEGTPAATWRIGEMFNQNYANWVAGILNDWITLRVASGQIKQPTSAEVTSLPKPQSTMYDALAANAGTFEQLLQDRPDLAEQLLPIVQDATDIAATGPKNSEEPKLPSDTTRYDQTKRPTE